MINTSYNDFGAKIRMTSAALRMSSAEIAQRLGMTPQLYSYRMKKARFSVSELESIAEAMGVKFVYYFELPDGTKV